MAERLKDYQPESKPGPSPKYAWDRWLNGSTWRLHQGTEKQVDRGDADFACSIGSMVDLIRKTAKDRGVSVSVFKEEAAVVIRPKEDKPEEARKGSRKPRKRSRVK